MIELFENELLRGSKFLSMYKQELDTLYADTGFMDFIHSIQKKNAECAENIEEIKRAAKVTMYENRVSAKYPALKNVVDDVASQGYTKNSAYISIYLSMRIYEISGIVAGKDSKTMVCPDLTEKNVDYRRKWPADFRCDNGIYVRSLSELFIAEWLYANRIAFEYERAVCFSGEVKPVHCDFYLPDYNIYIEFWGMEDDEQYTAYKKWKEELYHKDNYQLISLTFQDLKTFRDSLNCEMRRFGKTI